MQQVSYQIVDPEEEGQRLDNYLIRILKGVPKSHIYRIIRGGEVRINKKRAKVNTRLQTGDTIRIPPIRTSTEKSPFLSDRMANTLNLAIIYEDNQLLVINKPAGIAVHGGSGQSLGLIEALRQLRQDLHYLELVHRLDKETSGCLLLAKKRSTLRAIQAELMARRVQKTYWALCLNPWQGKKQRTVDLPLKKNILRSGERMVRVDSEGKAAQTALQCIENFRHCCWLQAKPVTGRTHQIRVHCAHTGHVILGDKKYGFHEETANLPAEAMKRLYLHASAIQFTLNGKAYHFEAEIDAAFTAAIEKLRQGSKYDDV